MEKGKEKKMPELKRKQIDIEVDAILDSEKHRERL